MKSYGTQIPDITLLDVQKWADGSSDKLKAMSERIYADGRRPEGVGGYAPNLKAMRFITG